MAENAQCSALCERWRTSAAIGLDTEFVRTRTFFARLGLLQVGDEQDCWLIDVLEIDDWRPFGEVMTDPGTVKVLHSASEDLEVLHNRLEVFPGPVFDTQIAAALVGLGYSLGYQALVKEVFGIAIPKGETRSNWLSRPLRKSQMEYAGLDVAYLLPIYEYLAERLDVLGRTAWAREEFERQSRTAEARLDPAWGFERLKKGRLTARQCTVLRRLSDWREEVARHRDLPRHFVASDEVLIHLARARPTNLAALKEVRGLRRSERARGGRAILDAVAQGMKDPLEKRTPRGLASGQAKGTIEALKKIVEKAAEEHDLPASFLAQRRLLSELIARSRAGEDEWLPEELRGWRRAVVGDELVAELERRS